MQGKMYLHTLCYFCMERHMAPKRMTSHENYEVTMSLQNAGGRKGCAWVI